MSETSGAVDSLTGAGTATVLDAGTTVPADERAPVAAPPNGSPVAAAPVEPEISRLIPRAGEFPVEVARHESVVLTSIPSDRVLEPVGAVDLGAEDAAFYSTVGEGLIITTEQRWEAKAVTLGRLLHSLALAPGESTRIAVVDWTRRDSGSLTGDVTAKDDLSAVSEQDRLAKELAESKLREQQRGSTEASSVASSTSAAVNASYADFFGGVGASASSSLNTSSATTVARSSGERDAALSTAQNIAARTRQMASAARTQTAATVKETSQAEGENVSTRVVTNYNHMHALSICYYEVVQVYDVTTTTVRIDRCVFIPMQVLTFAGDTGMRLVRRYRDALATAALSPAWAKRIAEFDPFAVNVVATRASLPVGVDQRESVASSEPAVKLKDLATGADGEVWGINDANIAVRWDNVLARWAEQPTPDSGLEKIAVGGRNIVWATAPDKGIRRYNASTGTFENFAGAARQIACGPDGVAWHLGIDDGQLRRLNNARDEWDSWGDDGGSSIELTASSRTQCWVLGPDLKPWSWTEGSKPLQDRNDRRGIRSIALAADGSLWGIAVDDAGSVVRWEGTAWVACAAGAMKVAPVNRTEYWYLRSDGQPVHVTTRELTPRLDKPDGNADAERLTVWADARGIRALELALTGAGGLAVRLGRPPAGIEPRSYDFTSVEPVDSVEFISSREDGGSLRRILLKTGRQEHPLGSDVSSTDETRTVDLDGQPICGLFGHEATIGDRGFIASAGFYVRGEAAAADLLRHLAANDEHYSQAVWANADELTLSRMLGNHFYAPSHMTEAERAAERTVPLGARVDPKPVAMTGNYLAFRWNFPDKDKRRAWLEDARLNEDESIAAQAIALPSGGVFAEAVLGQSNSAEKLDLTRFWDWQDSPIPILPPEISPVGTGTRARDLGLTQQQLGPLAAQLQQLQALPDPTGMAAATKTLASDIFRDMSNSRANAELAQKALATAGDNEKAAGANALAAAKAAMEHHQAMTQLAIDAASKVLPMIAPQAGIAGALGGILGGGGAAGASGALESIAGAGAALGNGSSAAAALAGLVGGSSNGALSSGGMAAAAAQALTGGSGGGALAGANNSRVGAVMNTAQALDARSPDTVAAEARQKLLDPAIAELKKQIPMLAKALKMTEAQVAAEIDSLSPKAIADIVATQATT
jgi:hypothetical protein